MAPPSRRRTVLKVIGLGLGSAATAEALAGEAAGDGYVVVQGDRCIPVTPLSGDVPAAELYDYGVAETDYSSAGTVDLQRDDTSILFLYDGPDAVSLVFVHGKKTGTRDSETGGSVSMSLSGLPADGEWVVEDDRYDGPANYDVWDHGDTTSEIDWTWAGGRTDGGVFEGMTADATVRVVPEFNADATLYGEHYDGKVTDWQLLSGDRSNPERTDLSMDAPITIRGGGCPDGGTDGSSTSDDGDGGDDTGSDDDTDETKHRKKQRKHQKKHEKKQRKHRKQRRKHEEKDDEGKKRGKGKKHREKDDEEDDEGKKRGKGKKHREKDDEEDDD